jgi:hypothetical protein
MDAEGGRTTVRWLLAGGEDDAAVVRGMADRVPPGGMAPGRVRTPMAAAAYRLLDRKVLLAAARCLDQDVAGPIASWLTTFEELRASAARSVADPEAREVVPLDVRQRLTATQGVTVHVSTGAGHLASFPFRLQLAAVLGRSEVVVRTGAVHEVHCTGAALEASLAVADVSPPLWERKQPVLALHLLLAKPVRIPLVPIPRGPAAAPARPPMHAE